MRRSNVGIVNVAKGSGAFAVLHRQKTVGGEGEEEKREP
jgi:hypothetical protein